MTATVPGAAMARHRDQPTLVQRMGALAAGLRKTRSRLDALLANWPDTGREATSWLRLGHRLGLEEGIAIGRALAEAEMAARWDAIAAPVAATRATFTELEERRWGPGGRTEFAAPRPNDFPGRR